MSLLKLSKDVWNEIVLYIDISEWQHIEILKSIKIWDLTKKRKILLLRGQGYKYFAYDEIITSCLNNYNNFEYVYEPSEEIQLLAVKQNCYAIRHIKKPNKRVQQLAVQRTGYAIKYIKNPSEEIQRIAVQKNGHAIKYIDNPSEEIQQLLCSTTVILKKV